DPRRGRVSAPYVESIAKRMVGGCTSPRRAAMRQARHPSRASRNTVGVTCRDTASCRWSCTAMESCCAPCTGRPRRSRDGEGEDGTLHVVGQHQDDDDDEDQTQSPAGGVAPVPAVTPGRQSADEGQNQYDDQNGREHGGGLGAINRGPTTRWIAGKFR